MRTIVTSFSVLGYEYYNIIFSCKEAVTDFDYIICVRIGSLFGFIEVVFLGNAFVFALAIAIILCIWKISGRPSVNEIQESIRIFISLFMFFEEDFVFRKSLTYDGIVALSVFFQILKGRTNVGSLESASAFALIFPAL